MKKHNKKNILSNYVSTIKKYSILKYYKKSKSNQNKSVQLQNEVQELEYKITQLITDLDYNKKESRLFYIFGFFCIIAGIFILLSFQEDSYIGAIILMCSVFALSMGKSYPINEINEKIIKIESEIYFLKAQKLEEVEKAERLFKYHQSELKKYYDQTLEHNKKIFWTGISCILLGVVIIFITMIIILYADKILNINISDNIRLLTAIFGGIGTILTNFIAVIYLKMYSETIKSLSSFHSRLVTTHHLHLANSINSKIVDIKLRDKTFASSTLEIIKTAHLWELFDKTNANSSEKKKK